MLIYVNWAAYEATLVRGLPLEPVKGRQVTAAETIFDDPNAVLRDVKNERRFAASAAVYGFPAPGWFGYSYISIAGISTKV